METETEQRLQQAIHEGKIEFVRPSKDGTKGYYRRVPKNYQNPSIAQAEARLALSEISNEKYRVRGTVLLRDGRRVQRNALVIGTNLRGKKFSGEKLTNIEKILMLVSSR